MPKNLFTISGVFVETAAILQSLKKMRVAVRKMVVVVMHEINPIFEELLSVLLSILDFTLSVLSFGLFEQHICIKSDSTDKSSQIDE